MALVLSRATATSTTARQFFRWCEKHAITELEQIKPVINAAYIEQHSAAAPTVKQRVRYCHQHMGKPGADTARAPTAAPRARV